MATGDNREEKEVECHLEEHEVTGEETEISEKEDKEMEVKKEERRLVN